MIIKYTIVDPTKNITALVETPVDEALQPDVALKIMEQESSVEQVGFVCGNKLRMAGGEFCGNASMSAAVLLCEKSGLNVGERRSVEITASGADKPVTVEVLKNKNGSFTATVGMPMPVSIGSVSLEFDGVVYTLPLVRFKGVSHLISEGQLNREMAEKAIADWCRELGADGLGIMLFDRQAGTLNPLVYVPNPETLVWESSCASGTSAVGAYLARSENKSIELTLKEPGGSLTVYSGEDTIRLTGNVRIIGNKWIEE